MEHRRTIHYDPTRRQRANRLPGHAKARVSIWSVITDFFQRFDRTAPCTTPVVHGVPIALTSSCLMAGGRDHGLRCADPCGALLRERH
jgi:hypothetical protein